MTRDVEGRLLLVHFLRDHLALTGTHWGCDTSNCGSCAVWLDGEPVKSCTVLAAMAGGHEVRTVEGLEQFGELDPVQRGFMQCHGLQCGFCTPGDADDGPGPARPQPGPVGAGDPGGHLRPDLPLHRLRHDRPVGPVGRRRGGGHPDVEPTVVTATVTATGFVDNDLRPIGHGRMLRKEDPRFVRGRGQFVDDVQLPGMLHLAILRSPLAHARILRRRHQRRRRRIRR